MNNLREMVFTGNPREFLRWDVVLETMFTSNERYILTEFNHLKAKPDWNERWQKAIEEVTAGRPMPYNKYYRSSGNLIHHAYHISQLEEKTDLSADKIDFIFEFGGGYGSMCRLLYNLGFKGKYAIFDLPHFSALQRYFLKTIGITVYTFDNFQFPENGVVCTSDIQNLKDILLSHCDASNSLFIATWSISETPLNLRNSILPLVSSLDSFLIADQDNFGEINNIRYFEEYKHYHEDNIKWSQWRIKHLPGNTYLVGTRIVH